MIEVFFYLLLFPALWIVSLFILKGWKYFNHFFIINLVLILSYLYLISFTKIITTNNDPYQLNSVFYNFIFLFSHTILGFIFALIYKFNYSKNGNK